MSKVKSYGNRSTELRLRKLFLAYGIKGWRRHYPIAGKPDFVFLHDRVAVFVDGCFWHGCPKCYKRPHTNQRFWREKYRYNAARDRLVVSTLKKAGWHTLRLWEHELNRPDRVANRVARLLQRRIGRR